MISTALTEYCRLVIPMCNFQIYGVMHLETWDLTTLNIEFVIESKRKIVFSLQQYSLIDYFIRILSYGKSIKSFQQINI